MPINDFSHYQLTWYPDKNKLTRPIYKSLLDQLKSAIERGILTSGTKLPPQRELADYLDINFTTVTRYSYLQIKCATWFNLWNSW
ncbi:GntR family transcriptional regulator [Limosilactobacillus reuteri]|uniref:GntR family transcriptional regulator n=1 Tax=Limosilactobacillus reuteri TaxID=1598 RepID=UPI001CDC734A|nr:GntR family transcriptional regulator [Limosilactobacillus reuteri]